MMKSLVLHSSLFKRMLLAAFGLATLSLPAFSLLWLRHQIHLQSQYGRKLEEEFAAVGQQIGRLNVQMARLHSPSFLRHRYAKGLSLPTRSQVVWV
ncbi:MAG: hypothetical protein LBR62_01510, partial [Puniceicoccales bacterium]|nr:hypothetical protein [Puniceicoccales bacterium]